jgi:hypothetical protein
MAGRAISVEDQAALDLKPEFEVIDTLGGRIMEFVASIQSGGVESLDALLPSALRVTQHYRMMAERAEELAQMAVTHDRSEAVQAAISELQLDAVRLLGRSAPTSAGDPVATLPESLDEFEARYHACKASLLRGGSRRELASTALVRELDRISALRRIVEQAVKARLLFEDLDRATVRLNSSVDAPGESESTSTS